MKKLSVVIPAYNERQTISAIVGRVEAVELPAGMAREIILVDDGSTDGTTDILRTMNGGSRLVLVHERNMGKGAAVRTGCARSSGDIVLIQDADLEYDPREYPKLLAPILDGRADVVYGSRYSGYGGGRPFRFWHSAMNRFLTILSNVFTRANLTDMETGYKVFRGDIIRSIRTRENRFGFEPEVTSRIARSGFRIHEVGISYAGRSRAEGKKVTWKDGVGALWCILKYR